ncbi:hypothetical protein D3C87_898880 [compost metagenome]
MPPLAPANTKPDAFTDLPVPAFSLLNVAVPLLTVTSAKSAGNTPVKVLVKMVAVVLPSYTLLSAVKLAVRSLAVISAVAVLTEPRV